MKGTVPMTKIEAFRLAVAEMGEATSEEISAYIERKFGVVISAPYIPIFRATLQFQKSPFLAEKSGGSSCLPNSVQ